MTRHPTWLIVLLLLAAGSARAESGAPGASTTSAPLQVTTGPTGTPPQDAVPAGVTVVYSKWSAQLYGFVELDSMYDSTQSYLDSTGGSIQAAPSTYAGRNGRLQFSIRDTRFGFRLAAPEFHGVKASGLIEMDFLGNENAAANPDPTVANTPAYNSEAAFFNNPSFRIRNAYVKLENPYIDFLAGQYWELFGWQPFFTPNYLELPGIPGSVLSRTAQIRLSHTFRSEHVTVDIAGSLGRPVQRDSLVPDVQAGLKLTLNDWKGLHTIYATGTSIDALTIGVSGVYRHFDVLNYAATPTGSHTTNGGGVSVDAFIPIIPATEKGRGNALSVTGSYVDGYGIADQYVGLTGGVGFPTPSCTTPGFTAVKGCPEPAGSTFAPTYSPDIDNGYVTYTSAGKLTPIEWQSFIVGLQYYLPPGNVWVSSNFAQLRSPNAQSVVAASGLSKVVAKYQFADANLFWDVTPQVRLGLEYAWFNQFYGNNSEQHDNRVQFSAFYLF